MESCELYLCKKGEAETNKPGTRKRGKRLNVIGVLEKGKIFEYGLSWSGITSETYIKFIDWQAEKAEKHFQKTGQITVIIQDNYSVHKSQKIKAKEREWQDKNLEFFFLSAYSPELNEIEPEWHQLKAHELAGRMFEDEYDLIQAVIQAIEDRNERNNCTYERLQFNSLSNSQELS